MCDAFLPPLLRGAPVRVVSWHVNNEGINGHKRRSLHGTCSRQTVMADMTDTHGYGIRPDNLGNVPAAATYTPLSRPDAFVYCRVEGGRAA